MEIEKHHLVKSTKWNKTLKRSTKIRILLALACTIIMLSTVFMIQAIRSVDFVSENTIKCEYHESIKKDGKIEDVYDFIANELSPFHIANQVELLKLNKKRLPISFISENYNAVVLKYEHQGKKMAIKYVKHRRIDSNHPNELHCTKKMQEKEYKNLVRIYHVETRGITHTKYNHVVIYAMEYLNTNVIGYCYNDEKRIVEYTKDILTGLNNLYEEKWVHLDLKPYNTAAKVTKNERIYKIIDYGNAMKIPEKETRIYTGKGYGTPGYMDPQSQLKGEYGHYCDIWAQEFIQGKDMEHQAIWIHNLS
ncbi:M3K1 [Enterospora canceri]|uniref:M3K1 n=1 Tax=Enterospora canceri TaxID=1081671 RepID=A0A1Y1S4H2_9MICR|nr:M3K1 [Enterospora canceri]